MRKRLRQSVDFESLYKTTYNHALWAEHRVRSYATAGIAAWFDDVKTAADLSCGDGFILKTISETLQLEKAIFGDYVNGYEYCGPIQETINQIPAVDLFILSETIEHLENPDAVLSSIRLKTKYLILSTPDGEWDNGNPEHLWGWDSKEMESMLRSAGFIPNVFSSLSFPIRPYYTFQMWGCT